MPACWKVIWYSLDKASSCETPKQSAGYCGMYMTCQNFYNSRPTGLESSLGSYTLQLNAKKFFLTFINNVSMSILKFRKVSRRFASRCEISLEIFEQNFKILSIERAHWDTSFVQFCGQKTKIHHISSIFANFRGVNYTLMGCWNFRLWTLLVLDRNGDGV